MNIASLHSHDKPVQAKRIFDANEKQVNAMQILGGHQLKKHVSAVPAFLICVKGEVVYHEQEVATTLLPGDFVNIQPNVPHWVDGKQDSHLLLIK